MKTTTRAEAIKQLDKAEARLSRLIESLRAQPGPYDFSRTDQLRDSCDAKDLVHGVRSWLVKVEPVDVDFIDLTEAAS